MSLGCRKGYESRMKDIYFLLDAESPDINMREEMEILYVLTGRVGVMLTGRNFLLQPEDFIDNM
jgi:mannose-6-phosphate isomerase-like protein (cupin superfamily)